MSPGRCLDRLGGPFIFRATTTEQVGFSGEEERKNSKARHSVTATNSAQTSSMCTELKWDSVGMKTPRKWVQIKMFCHVCDFGLRWRSLKAWGTINVCQVKPGRVCARSHEMINEITVSLSLSSPCTVYCWLRDELSARVYVCTSWAGGLWWLFYSVLNKEEAMKRRAQDQYLPLQLTRTYTSFGIVKINDQLHASLWRRNKETRRK